MARPIREISRPPGYRDDTLFIIACDDTYAPDKYFGFLRLSRVKFEVIGTPKADGGSIGTYHARDVLQRLEKVKAEKPYPGNNEYWMLLDIDHHTQSNHIATFRAVLREAKQKNIAVALSKPCFELWLLLHAKEDGVEESQIKLLKNAGETIALIKEIFGPYNKKNLNPDHYPLESIARAWQRAKALDTTNLGDIPETNSTHIYKILESVFSKTHISQIPAAFKPCLSP